ncbi:hypothetical protein QL285_044578 [Trifolium repens]|nr:hypothetical protein QL285_044578 [Trifolium repens]
MPNFSLGLTPSEEEGKTQDKNQRNRGKRGGGTKINDESSDDNKEVKEKRLSQKNKGKKNEDTDGNSEGQNIDQRLRHKLSIPKVYDLMESIKGKKRKDDILKLLNESGFGGLTHLSKWTKIHTFFVEWIVKHFEKQNMWIRLGKTDVLPLTKQDVNRVYGLPMSGERIIVDRCSEAAIKRLRKELGLVGNYSTFVKVTELEAQMKILEKPMSWVKGAICLIIHNILCPTNSSFVSLH